MKAYKYYLFDFDGTLIDSIHSSEYVFMEAYKAIGITIKKEDVLGYTREPIPDSYKRLNAPEEKWGLFAERILALGNSQKSVDLCDIYDDTYDTIADLRMAEATLGIVTSNNAPHVRDILRKFGLENLFFEVIVGNGEAPVPKPNPMPLNKALEMLGYGGDRSDVVYVGDSLNDVKAALAAHITPILLDRDDEYPDSGDYIKIKSLRELL